MLRSVLSVLAGIAVLTAASFAIEAAVDFILPRSLSAHGSVRILTYAYGMLCVSAGGFVAARIARRSPVQHAMAMGVVQAGITVLAMFSPERNHASPLQWIFIAACSMPAAVLGGILYKGVKSRAGLAKAPARA
jgi:putative membrane protein (TIGR04086 family)